MKMNLHEPAFIKLIKSSRSADNDKQITSTLRFIIEFIASIYSDCFILLHANHVLYHLLPRFRIDDSYLHKCFLFDDLMYFIRD